MNPAIYSKWYRVKPKGELELGLSLVRVRAWVDRFTANCTRPPDQRVKGELTPLELQSDEEAIIMEVQTVTYATEMDALKRNKQIPKRSTFGTIESSVG